MRCAGILGLEMRSAGLVSTVVGLAAVLLAGCGGTSSSDAARSAPTVLMPVSPPSPPAAGGGGGGGGTSVGAPAPDRAADRFVGRLGARCRRLDRLQAASRSRGESLRTSIEGEVSRLRRLQRLLGDPSPPRTVRKDVKRYTTALAAEIYLDSRIIAAIADNDPRSQEVGLRQNEFNRLRRRQLASRLGLPGCFRAPRSR